jgi:putative phosphonate metabolism protein
MGKARYGLYFAPEDDTALARFGWRWLGRQPGSPALLTLPETALEPNRQAEVVADARRYGFHATLKPPFFLAEDVSRHDLRVAAQAFATGRRPFVDAPFALAELHGFVAIRPPQPSAAIATLADDCVRHFDRFRAPATDEERRRRLAHPLTERQKHHVDAWGYPYVFEDFRFHLTLTCRLDDAERALYGTVLADLAGPVLAEPVAFRSLCLFEQATNEAPFVLAQRFPFGG